jgi:hypothetical protein
MTHVKDADTKAADANTKDMRVVKLSKNNVVVRQKMTNVQDINYLVQKDLLIKMFMDVKVEGEETKIIERALNGKINGYKAQDMKKNIYQAHALITFTDVLEKLVASQLKCVYCSKNVHIIYKNVREPTQWTLDRKDNDAGHSAENTVIACLKCNLQRRVTDEDKFMFTKKLVLVKGF